MDEEEVEKSDDLFQGACEVSGKTLTVLYDSGASHSFISHSCVTTLQMPIFELPYDLLVSTPTNKPIKTSQICVNVSLRIEGRIFGTNLIYLPLSGLDIILGRDWLFSNQVMLNCSNKIVVFPPVLSLESMTPVNLYLSSLVVNCCGMESQRYVLLSTNVTKVDQKLNDIPIVREYPDVFPKDIPEFPLEREIEFTIELVSGTRPISIAPLFDLHLPLHMAHPATPLAAPPSQLVPSLSYDNDRSEEAASSFSSSSAPGDGYILADPDMANGFFSSKSI